MGERECGGKGARGDGRVATAVLFVLPRLRYRIVVLRLSVPGEAFYYTVGKYTIENCASTATTGGTFSILGWFCSSPGFLVVPHLFSAVSRFVQLGLNVSSHGSQVASGRRKRVWIEEHEARQHRPEWTHSFAAAHEFALSGSLPLGEVRARSAIVSPRTVLVPPRVLAGRVSPS